MILRNKMFVNSRWQSVVGWGGGVGGLKFKMHQWLFVIEAQWANDSKCSACVKDGFVPPLHPFTRCKSCLCFPLVLMEMVEGHRMEWAHETFIWKLTWTARRPSASGRIRYVWTWRWNLWTQKSWLSASYHTKKETSVGCEQSSEPISKTHSPTVKQMTHLKGGEPHGAIAVF